MTDESYLLKRISHSKNALLPFLPLSLPPSPGHSTALSTSPSLSLSLRLGPNLFQENQANIFSFV